MINNVPSSLRSQSSSPTTDLDFPVIETDSTQTDDATSTTHQTLEQTEAADSAKDNHSPTLDTPEPNADKPTKPGCSSQSITRSRANTTSRYGPAPSHKPANKVSSEVLLYRGAIECPICFLFYPKYLNITRCCAQPICTECFVQIKRPDPHPPHDDHDDNVSNTPDSTTDSASSSPALEPLFVSEPACCPYCMLPDFGVTFPGCPFKSGLQPSNNSKKMSPLSPIRPSDNKENPSAGTSGTNGAGAPSKAVESPNSLGVPSTSRANKRRGSIPANAPDVITIDRIRPDWSLKLAAARAHAARKSAQATALHASAFLMEGRRRGSSNRRSRNRGNGGESGFVSTGAYTQAREARQRSRSLLDEANMPPGSNGSRYVRETRQEREAREEQIRTEQLENIMMMEAIRLSLIDEENRKAKEEE